MVWACLLMLAGVYALQLGNFASLVVLLVVVFTIGRLRAVACVFVGAMLFHVAAAAVIDSRISHEYVGDSIVTELRIVEFPVRRGPTTSFVAEVRANPWVPRRIRVSWFEPELAPELGDVWQVELRLRRPRGTSNPGVFDYETWLFRERISATAYVVESQRNVKLDTRQLDPLNRFRLHAVERIAEIVDDSERAAVLMAISVGARHSLTTEQWRRYARTGTSHLMAISGLHIGMAAVSGYIIALLVGGYFGRHLCQVQFATVAGLLAALLYALVSGLAVPAQRATLMIALAAAALLVRRRVRPFVIVACACMTMIVINPLVTMAPGFKLSFLAVVVLLLLARRRQAGMPLAAAQVHLFFGLAPLVAVLFGRMSLAAPLVNLAAVPVFSFVTVPFTLAGLIGVDWPLRFAAVSLDWIEQLLAMADAVEIASIELPFFRGVARLLLLAPLAWIVLPRGWPCRTIAWPGMVALCLYTPPSPPDGCADIDVLDVGHGLAVVATTAGETTIYDTGPVYRGGGSAAESVLLPIIASRRIRAVSKLIVSHADLDHAGGIDAVRDATPVYDVVVGERLTDRPEDGLCVAGDGWQSDGVRFEFLWPDSGVVRAGNDASCVLQISAGEHRVLLTGDIERDAEHELVRSGRLQPVAVVVVPHHGSATSSTSSFVAALQPQLAIVSAGFRNRWGLPDRGVIGRWQNAGADIISTASSGAVSLRLCERGGLVSVHRERQWRRRIWHD